jgi:hypothetical protein
MCAERTEATTGRCLCGDIRFEYRGAPIRTMHCHCESCRRHTSSPISTFITIDRNSFRYTQGAPVSFSSTPGVVERTHCGRCGSPISYETKEVFALYACTLDDPTQVKPTYHVLTGEQLPWLEIADDLPRYEYDSRNATPVSYGPRHPTVPRPMVPNTRVP